MPSEAQRYPWRLWDESRLTAGLFSAAYLLVSLLLSAHWSAHRASGSLPLYLAIVYLACALDRFVGLSARLARLVRTHARTTGWYWPWRRPLQVLGMVIVLGIAALFLSTHTTPQRSLSRVFLLAGALYTLLLITLRAISFHEFDMLLYRRRPSLNHRPLNALIEAVGIATAIAGVALHVW